MHNHYLARKKTEVHLDLTPLIDVVFLLLIFFMVSTSFEKTHWLDLTLPEVDETTQEAVADTKQIVIAVDERGQYFVNDDQSVINTVEELREKLAKLANADSVIVIHGDASAPHGAVIQLLDILGQLKVVNIHVTAVEG